MKTNRNLYRSSNDFECNSEEIRTRKLLKDWKNSKFNLWSSPLVLTYHKLHDKNNLIEKRRSLAVWQDTCHTFKNLIYDLALHRSPIAQWLERPTGILQGHGFDFRWPLRKFFIIVFRLENTSSLFTLYPSHQSIYQSFDYLLIINMLLFGFK